MGDVGGPLRVNPFSPSAVARVGLEGEAPVTVPTEAVTRAREHLSTYLTPGPGELDDVRPDGTPVSGQPAGRPGLTLAILGDYGTGKTHLAVHLMRQVKREAQRTGPDSPLVVHHGYLEAVSSGFDRMYRDFVGQLSRDVVLDTVRDYYADVVADSLARSPLTSDTAVQLRNRQLDPERVVDALGLIDSMLSRSLRETLIRVTEKEAFGIALTMLLRRKEFADDVWAWLTGAPPTSELAQRGITDPISGDDMVLEAMGVFACLYGRRRHRFVLVIDELDKVLTGRANPDRTTVDAFKKLFEVFQAAGALLVVVGLPDLLDVLGTSGEQRIAFTVRMPVLDGVDVRRLVELTHERAFGRPDLAPFTSGVPDLIAKLARGSARQIIRLCHRAYQRAIAQEAETITEETVREVARRGDTLHSRQNVRAEIQQVLLARGLNHQVDHRPTDVPAPVDFWIDLGDGDGCAVIVADSVVTEADAESLVARAAAITGRRPGRQALLVVSGYLNPDLQGRLTAAFGAEPLQALWTDVVVAFGAALGGVLAASRRNDARDSSAQLLEQLGWLSQQQVRAQSYLERLASHVADLRSSVDQQLTAVRREMRTSVTSPATSEQGRLPDPVDRAFQRATEALSQLDWVGSALSATLSPSDGPGETGTRQRGVRTRLNARDAYAAVGAVSLMHDLVAGFRSGIEEWYTFGDGSGTGGPGGQDALSALCRRYDALYFDLQRQLVDDYPPPPVGVGTFDEDGEQLVWTRRVAEARDVLDNLGASVQQAAWLSTGEPGADAGGGW